MLDGIITAPAPMTGATVFPPGRPHMPRNFSQIKVFLCLSAAARGLLVLAGHVVTHKAVDPRRIRKIKRRILPSVADMAAGATAPVGGNAYSEIVQELFFAQVLAVFMALNKGARAFPEVVSGGQDLLCLLFMAFEAFSRHRCAV
jgi:hypothetical protein